MSVTVVRDKVEIGHDAGAAPLWQVRVGTPLSRTAAIAAAAVVVGLALLPAIASRNLIQDLIFVFTMLALAQLWNVLAGWGGLVSVGQQAFVGLGAYALFAGVVTLGIDPVFAIPLAGLFAAVVAAVLGPLLFRLEGPYFAIGSWVAAEALRLICAQFKTLGGGTGMSISPSDLSQMIGLKSAQALFGLRPAAARDVLIYWIALLLAVAVTLGITAFVRSRMGLALAASRDNAAAARSVGVRTDRIRYLLWIVVAFATGMVGAVVYLQKARISPDAAFSVTDWTAYVIFIVVIGGVRTIEGPMIGVLTLWGLITYLAQYGSLYLVVLGTIAILIMLFMPKGVWGEIGRRWGISLFPTQRVLSRTLRGKGVDASEDGRS
jgi:branched-chain amino acid transport system permease protein